MYNILLVDDEENVRCNIRELTPWNEHGFNEPQTASNGREALDIMQDMTPDAIITDIRMPYMSGIEFVEEVRKKYPSSIDIVILSGYDEFSFAQEAVRLNVAEYVLKPVSAESICSLLDRIKARIDKEKDKYFDSAKLSELYREAFGQYKEQFLQSLILASKKRKDEDIIDDADKFGIDFRGNNIFSTVIIERQDSIKTQIALSEIIREQSEKSDLQTITFQCYKQTVLIFRSNQDTSDEPDFRKRVYKAMMLLSDNANHYLSTKLKIGIGNSVYRISDLRSSYRKAVEALNYSIFHSDESIIRSSDMDNIEENKDLKDFSEERSELVLAIKFAGQAEVDEAIDKFFLATMSFEDIQITVLYIFTIIIDICIAYSKTITDLIGPDEDLFQKTSRLRSLTDAVFFCRDFARRANKITSGARESSHIKFVENAKRIILRRYSDPLFGLDQLCDEISISPAYFSTTFKKETGISFVQFLTNTRIEKAKELLRNSNLKTYEIAEKVGFSEPNYFSFTFRRTTGISPSQYKNQAKI